MASIAVENVGPLRRTGRIDLKMVNLFIGKQSTGKSTLMKILCYCRWVEKKIMTGNDSVLSGYTHNNKFLKELMQFYRFNESAFSENSRVVYQGDCVTIYWDGTRNNARRSGSLSTANTFTPWHLGKLIIAASGSTATVKGQLPFPL